MRTLIIFLLMCGVAFAYGLNQKYSYKDFMNQSFKELPANEFNNSIIEGSNFYQDNKPDSDIFPDHLENVVFKKCNLDNVLIKEGMIVDNSNTNKKIQAQNDLEDWVVEKQGEKWVAKEPLHKNRFEEWGVSISPDDIPQQKLSKPRIKSRQDLVAKEVNKKIDQTIGDLFNEEKAKVISSNP